MDVIGSVLMYFLFIYIPPSLYLLLRGLTVVFSGLLAFKFLGRRLSPKQLASLVVVFSGIFISTLPEIRSHDPTPSSTHSSVVLGILLALIAQFLGGAQSVVEEAIFRRYTIEPILLAGMEGVFGLATIAVLTTAFYMMAGPEYLGGPMDLSLAVHQMVSTPRVLYTMLIFLVTQAFGYYFSLTFTRHMGATSRLTVDLCRTVLVWMISLAMGWETLNFVRVVGFSVLVYGYIAYDGSAKLPFFG
ncbi:hypothetical protein FBU59_006653 [Linderina macrospora]|uniref:Uncharacterized protein n=1 Tax=Linderina macrospora TaxID=4868 RepID=A0ACC1IZG0_9FUNG|nr:hypothetical protein FBU59_006653 [Linderina macrospora]